jgi:tripartite-type tricarboxylate transporter receptor subunit TctC
MPDVPTIAESGFPGFEAGSWFGVFAPRGTPPDVVAALNKATNEAIAEKSIEARMIEEGADPAAGTPERFGAFVRSEFEKWRTVVKESGAAVD